MIRKEKQKKNGECPIVIRITYNRKFIYHSIQENVKPQFWNVEDETPKKSCPNRDNIIIRLEEEGTKVRNLVLQHKLNFNQYPTIDEIKTILRKGKNTIIDPKDVIEYFKDFSIQYSKNKRLVKGTIKVYKGTELRLIEFFKSYDRPIRWETFDNKFYDDFVNYYIDKGYKEGSIGRIIKTLKTFLNFINLNYKLVNQDQFKTWKVNKGETDFVVLTKEELLIIKYYVGLIKNPKGGWFDNEEVQLNSNEIQLLSILLFLCLTGLSYVDFQKITIDDIENKSDLETDDTLCFIYNRQKTNISNKVFITITEDLIELLYLELTKYFNRNNRFVRPNLHIEEIDYKKKVKILWDLITKIKNNKGIIEPNKKDIPEIYFKHYPLIFPKIQNQIFNREIKKVLGKIGINEIQKVYEKRFGHIQEKVIEKNKLISSITGRRTFITHSLRDGISMEVLMKSTGQKDVRTLLKYTKIDQDNVNRSFLQKKKRLTPNDNWENRQVKKTQIKKKKVQKK